MLKGAESRSARLAELTWEQAAERLTSSSVVIIPIGAAAKEHGPHLPLNTDWLQAEYLATRIMERLEVVVAPCVSYHHYPAFSEYTGSISLRAQTARDLIVDICQSLARHGPRRFYALNTGISTLEPLKESAALLATDGITLAYTDLRKIDGPLIARLSQQARGTHADEIETSRMLYLAPEVVAMEKAVRDDEPENGAGGLTRRPNGPGVYSRSGIWGDATLATRDKGCELTESLIEALISDIRQLMDLQ